MTSAGSEGLDALLDEQAGYYRAVAREYEDHFLPFSGGDELIAAIDAFRPTGSVLELACGPGTFTPQLLRHATEVTAVDASAEMIAIASAKVDAHRVRFVTADLFGWRPDRRYDVVFFGFWLSHVPEERFASFWSMVADCLKPGGRVLFVDDFYRDADELVEGEESATIERKLTDGTTYRIVKTAHRPEKLETRLAEIGWRFEVHSTSGPFVWGSGDHPAMMPERNSASAARNSAGRSRCGEWPQPGSTTSR